MLLFSCDHIIIIVTQENGVVMANKDKKFILRKDMGNGVFYGSIIFSVWPGTQTSAFSDLKIA